MKKANIEKIKTWALFYLVIMSLFLSIKIWFQVPTPGEITQPTGDSGVGQNPNIVSSLSPKKIIVKLGNGQFTQLLQENEFYLGFWAVGQDVLIEMLSQMPEKEPGSVPLSSGPLVEMVFGLPVDMSLWHNLFIGKPYTEGNDFLVESLILDIKKGMAVLKGNDGLYSARVNLSDADLIGLAETIEATGFTPYRRLEELNDRLPAAKDVLVPVGEIKIPRIVIQKENTSPERLARKFFSDMSIVRKIEEKDGATIYTDGRLGLRIYKDGAVEYNHTSSSASESNTDLYRAFNLADQFISTHGGWPAGVYLDSIKPGTSQGRDGYTFTFNNRFSGLPMIGAKNAIEVSVNGLMVISYYKNFSSQAEVVGDYSSVIGASQAVDLIATSYDGFVSESEKGLKITDMFLAYYLSEDLYEPVPVWAVQFGGMYVYVNSLTGEVFAGVE
jgi:regulatory protein YycH of two-component signal transduction system YycFG